MPTSAASTTASSRCKDGVMTVAADAGSVAIRQRWSTTAEPLTWRALLLAGAGVGSMGAGAIHAAAIGGHAEFKAAVLTFTVLGVFQLAWGALAVWRPGRLVA